VRPVVEREGMLLMADDQRLTLLPGETIQLRSIRFRTLGCYPLTGAIESTADTVAKIIHELRHVNVSERQGRAIDYDNTASMEMKKQEGYF
jgi:sulfate adenylyltransferase subunit 2